MTLIHPRTLTGIALATVSALLLSACGGSDAVSATAVARCAHAQQRSTAGLASPQHQIAAKVVSGGWLDQNYSAETGKGSQTTPLELYVFPSSKVAEEAFKMIAGAGNAHEEWGGGGTFLRKNVIVNTDQNPPSSLTADAETLLNRCVGTGASQQIIRPHEEVVDGHTSSERTRAEEDGYTLPSEGTDTTGTNAPEPAQEPPASENVPNPGQSPAPTREGE